MRHDVPRQVARIALVVPHGAYLGSIGAYADAVELTRSYVLRQYGAIETLSPADRFDVARIDFIALSGAPVLAVGVALRFARLDPVGDRYDVVVIVDHAVDDRASYAPPPHFAGWLERQRAGGALTIASGAGTFLLAATGALDGRAATGPWWLAQRLRDDFPAVRFDFSLPLVRDDDVICTAGLAADAAGAITMIEHVASHNSAAWLARRLLPRDATAAGEGANDALLARAQQWLSEHFSSAVRIADLAAALGVDRRTLARHFQRELATTPIAYLQMLRIEAAKRLLERAPFTIERIAGLVGYSDGAFFRKAFRAATGHSPRSWRRLARADDPDG